MTSPAQEQVFGRYLSIQRPVACPEIALWLVDGKVDLNARCEELLDGGYAPYWAFCWGAGQALARHVLDRPELVRGKRVVDFGAGSGVAAIASALSGAREVVAVDIDPKALTFCEQNAKLNGVQLQVMSAVPDTFDVLLASDVLYEVSVRAYLLSLRAPNRMMYVADPRRPGNPRFDFAPIATYAVQCLPDVDYPVSEAAIYELAAFAFAGE